jgi:hypothetical protein
VPSIPYKYLINDESEIIKIFKGGGQENMESLKEFVLKYLKKED